LAEAPEVRGFRLGMSYAELQKRFPKLPKPTDIIDGVSTLSILLTHLDKDEVTWGDFHNVDKFPDLKDVSSIKLTLVDNRVVAYDITYSETKDRDFAMEFLTKAGKSLGVEDYTTEHEEPFLFKVTCEGYRAHIELRTRDTTFMGAVTNRIYIPSLGVEDIGGLANAKKREEDAKRKLAEEIKRKEDEHRRTFQP
jgi:hypothetical protein